MKWLKRMLMRNPMIAALAGMKGNARACLWPEPLWGVPYNLYLPYASLFMAALGLSPSEIGYVASINIVSQVVFATLSGVITDKLGRRWTTFIFDVLSWSVPEFLWMLSQDFRWFAAAAVFNGAWRVTENSWSLLLIDDMKEEEIVPAFSLTQMLGLFSAFFAPLSKLAIDAFGLVPTMRVLYGITFVSMTIKFILVQAFSRETGIGRRRMAATKNKSMLRLLYECKDVYIKTVMSKRMLLTFGVFASYSLVTTLTNNYWALLVCQELGVAQGNVVFFTTIKSLVTLLCVLFLVPRVTRMPARYPLITGFFMHMTAMAMLLLAPRGAVGVALLFVSVLLEAVSLSVLSPMTSSLLFINAGEEERARVCGLIYGTISLITAVFPSIIGLLAEISLRIPFAVCVGLFAFAAALVVPLSRMPAHKEAG
ncbi:MAG: MFS transporter [Clostridiales bacterium]|nr:MFS transporter [Clostridiales bacterium]